MTWKKNYIRGKNTRFVTTPLDHSSFCATSSHALDPNGASSGIPQEASQVNGEILIHEQKNDSSQNKITIRDINITIRNKKGTIRDTYTRFATNEIIIRVKKNNI